ncbi:hypothetical protein [Anabaena azotica]|uniref:Uncharacterized protein n=1 Tax=Anabaena azotica FACHB-119 TaxID=947527 RepID=A0ABR8DA68_9NOST|nr:hypothetical protein [Anabaena azotica]MBD2504077.1 hypothetical protein [Anabaena azotica FACHB-119]
MGIIEVVINYICLSDQANGFCRYSPELTSRIEIDDQSWDGYTQLAIASPLACPLHTPFLRANDHERYSLYLYGTAMNLECKP